MKPLQQIPRNALVWLLLAAFALVAPHVPRLPGWVLLVYLAAAVWRVMVYRGAWSFPRWPVKLVMVSAACAGIVLSFRSLVGLEPTVALLLTAFALKLVELATRKDAYVLVFLSYFVILTEFLFSQDLLMVLFCLANTVLVTAALVAIHRPDEQRFNGRPLRLASVMVLQSLPLMLVLFFLFPRIGPLWTVPIKSQAARTGMSDFMRPGDVSQLSRSGEVAFRVEFEGDIPASRDLYWRGLVLSRLEDSTWRTLDYYEIPAAERRAATPALAGDALRYTVIMAPTQQRWVYGLRFARSSDPGILEAPDFRLFRVTPIEDTLLYEVSSWPAAALEPTLSPWRQEQELRLPGEDNARTRRLAESWLAAGDDPAAVVQRALALFSEQPFVYTLQPPLLPERDGVDAFLFDTRRGFCEHYAAAFVTLMRAAGVPARVVAGYQGGEVNPVNRTVIVRQFDAHAWAEVWLAGQGWVRVDPTAAVAPDRIELGLEQALAGEGTFLADNPLSPLRFRGIGWVDFLRLRYDAISYRWQAWVVGFDAEQQFDLLTRWFGEFRMERFAAVLLGAGLLVLAPAMLALALQRRTHNQRPLDRVYLRFCQRLTALGVSRQPGEAPASFARRAVAALPGEAAAIEDITRQYSRLAYGRGGAGQDDLARLARAVRRLGR